MFIWLPPEKRHLVAWADYNLKFGPSDYFLTGVIPTGEDAGNWDVYYMDGYEADTYGAIRLIGPNRFSCWEGVQLLRGYFKFPPTPGNVFHTPRWLKVGIPAARFLLETAWITVPIRRLPAHKRNKPEGDL